MLAVSTKGAAEEAEVGGSVVGVDGGAVGVDGSEVGVGGSGVALGGSGVDDGKSVAVGAAVGVLPTPMLNEQARLKSSTPTSPNKIRVFMAFFPFEGGDE